MTGYSKYSFDLDPGPDISVLSFGSDYYGYIQKFSQPVNVQTIGSDAAQNTVNDPTFYEFTHSYSTWGVAGVRPQYIDSSMWHLELFNSNDFLNPITFSQSNNSVGFVVFDQHHLANTIKGIKVQKISGEGNARTEFEGYNEIITVGTPANHNWIAGDVVEIWDVYLSPGSYHFVMNQNSGLADLEMALYSSGSGSYYQNRNQYIAVAANVGTSNESFYVNVAQADFYGFVVWSNNAGSANVDISVSVPLSGIWTGVSSTNWNTASNWSDNQVPGTATDVLIPPGTTYSPNVNWANANAKTISLLSGATLNIGSYDLFVQDDSYFYGTLNLITSSADFYSYGDINWEPGSQSSMVAGAEIRIYGDWNFNTGNNVQLNSGTVIFMGTAMSTIRAHEWNCQFHNIECAKTSSAYVFVTAGSTANLLINGDLSIDSGAKFMSATGWSIILQGSLINYGGHFEGINGSFEFAGSVGDYLRPNVGDYFNTLIIDVTGAVDIWDTYSDSMIVNKDLIIKGGTLDCNNNTIAIGRDWDNQVGPSGFLEKNGTVLFNGNSGFMNCYGDNFYNVTRSNAGGYLEFEGETHISNNFEIYGYTLVKDSMSIANCYTYSPGSLRAGSGCVISIDNLANNGGLHAYMSQIYVNELMDDGLYGVYWLIGSNALIDIIQGTNPGEFVDLNGTVRIENGGTMIVRGGADDSYWPYSANASITLESGTLDFTDVGIRIHNSPTWSLTSSITGGTIRTTGDFRAFNTYNPNNGTLEFYGGEYQYLNLSNPNSSLSNLLVNKTGSQVDCISNNVNVRGDLTIDSGVLGSPDDTLFVGGDWTNNVDTAAFLEGNNTVCFNGTEQTKIHTNEVFYDLVIEKNTGTMAFPVIQESTSTEVIVNGNNFHIIEGRYRVYTPWSSSSVLDIDCDLLIEMGGSLYLSSYCDVFLEGDLIDYNTDATLLGLQTMDETTWTFDGTGTQVYNVTAPNVQFGNLIIDKPVGSMLEVHHNLRVFSIFTMLSGDLVNVGTHNYSFYNDFINNTSGYWNDHSSTVQFIGHLQTNLDMGSDNGYFGHVEIVKLGTNDSLTIIDQLRILGGGTLDINTGTLVLDDSHLNVAGYININSNGELVMNENSVLNTYSGTVTINAGGKFFSLGTATNRNSILSIIPGSVVDIDVNSGGTIGARFTDFSQMGLSGVHIKTGAIVDSTHSFFHCSFLDGVSGGQFVIIDNDQTFVVEYANFSDNTSSLYNVTKTVNTGEVTFLNSSGVFAGESYDNDVFNRIHWNNIFSVSGVVTNETCYSSNDGSIQLNVSGGTSAYIYLWSDGSTSSQRQNLSAGAYMVTVSDFYGITTTAGFTITQPDPYLLSPNTINDVTCFSGSNGQITLLLSGGVPPDTYLWSNGSTNSSLSGVSAGTYSVTCTDSHGCTVSTSGSIQEPPILAVSALITDVSVSGGNDGSIDVSTTGGTPPYTYLWSNAISTEDLFGLVSSTYTLTVTDSHACTASDSWLVDEPAATSVQTINLPSGWSIVSTYMNPIIPSMEAIFSSIVSELIIVKNGNGDVYWPSIPLNMIGNNVPGEGYQVKMNSAQFISVSGTPIVPEATPVTVVSGWSIIGYLRQVPGNIETMLSSISADIIIVKDGNGFVYWPSVPLNMIGNMTAGQGYQIKMSSAGILTYPTNNVVSKTAHSAANPVHFIQPQPGPANMTIGIDGKAWGDFINFGDEIAAFNKAGKLAGSCVYEDGTVAMAVWARDEQEQDSYGCVEDEMLSFKLFNKLESKEQIIVVSDWLFGDGIFRKDDIQLIGKIKLSGNTEGVSLFQNMPNPCNEETLISYYLPTDTHISLNIYDLSGKQIAELVNGHHKMGKHEFLYSASNLATGCYVYRLETDGFIASKQMNIIR